MVEQKKREELRRKKLEEESQARHRLRADEVFSDNDDSDHNASPRRSDSPSSSDSDSRKKRARRSSGSSSSSGSSAGSDSEAEGRNAEEDKEARKKAEFIKTKEELSKIRLSRHRLERWCYMPYMKHAVIGCYVRIGIGSHQGKPVYRVSAVISSRVVFWIVKRRHLAKVESLKSYSCRPAATNYYVIFKFVVVLVCQLIYSYIGLKLNFKEKYVEIE